MGKAATSKTVLQAATEGQGINASNQLVMLVAHAPPGALIMRSSFTAMQAAIEGQGVPACSHLQLLVAYRSTPPEDLKSRAWTFALDGHTFYVITLGEQGTYVYDQTTQQWARWQTQGFSSWNMEIGTTWRGDVIAADRDNPIIWRLNPDSFIDNDFKAQIRKVTGGLAMRQRAFIANYSFSLTASLGTPDVPLTAPITLPTVKLSFSDDQGKTFTDAETLTLTLDDFTQRLDWRSLGTMQAPQRIFKITDTGAIARIDGADAEVGEEGT